MYVLPNYTLPNYLKPKFDYMAMVKLYMTPQDKFNYIMYEKNNGNEKEITSNKLKMKYYNVYQRDYRPTKEFNDKLIVNQDMLSEIFQYMDDDSTVIFFNICNNLQPYLRFYMDSGCKDGLIEWGNKIKYDKKLDDVLPAGEKLTQDKLNKLLQKKMDERLDDVYVIEKTNTVVFSL
jgi:hypothetical protein